MIFKTLPPVTPAAGGQLPPSQTVTSCSAAKMAEQYYHVPVRNIASDYMDHFQANVTAFLAEPQVSQELALLERDEETFPYDMQSLRPVCRMGHPHVINGVLIPDQTLLSAYMFTDVAMEALCSLFFLREKLGLWPLPPEQKPFGAKVSDGAMPYLMLLYDLDLYGIIRGITYDYDKDLGSGIPRHHDTRTFHIDAQGVLDLPAKFKISKPDFLNILHEGRQIDGDAGPLFDFFEEAFSCNDEEDIRGIEKRAGLAVGLNPPGRDHDVGVTTFVKAF